MILKDICNDVTDLVRVTGRFIERESEVFDRNRNDILTKETNSFVTGIDLESERKLVAGLESILPEAGFITEEKTIERHDMEYMWVIDPIDGTTNFIYGIPCYSISIALLKNNEPIIGVVYEVNREECFYAWENGGAFLNNQSIRVSGTEDLKNSLLATGFPYYDFGKTDAYLAILGEFMRSTRGIRRLGSAAVDLAYVACGRFDGFYEHTLNVWDVAAGALIVKEAGGLLTDFEGGNNFLFGKEIIASGPDLLPSMLKVIRPYFYG